MKNTLFIFFTAILVGIGINTQAQPALEKDYSYVMEIPSMITMESSPAHLYALSDTEGMAVFRTRQDTLQWLYSSTGMEQRGNTTTADIRFAYLFGDSRRLTVLEPTSVLGVYSSTILPSNPRDAKRIDQNLYVALGNKGLGKISLRTPASVDSTLDFVERSLLSRENIIDLETSENQLFALSKDQKVFRFNYEDGQLSLSKEIEFSGGEGLVNRIFLVNDTLLGSDESGKIYEIDRIGYLIKLGSIGETVTKIESWQDWLIIRGSSNRLWTSYQNRRPELWKEDSEAGNHFTVAKDNLWLSEYNKISRVVTTSKTQPQSTEKQTEFSGTLSLKGIPNQTIPHTKPVLIPIQLKNDLPASSVQFSYQSGDIQDAEIRGQSFYWQPSSGDTGNYRVKIIASATNGQIDSTSFSIDVNSFNSPPRFAPIRPISIPVDEEFSLPFKATDPDGPNSELIRFLGVDLPEGASIDEKTGTFRWTPSARQVGENQFRIIATDQYGAAKSVDATITVVENVRQNSGD